MPQPVIIFDHIYKKFARGEQHTTLRDLIPALVSKWWNKKQIDEQALKAEEFWAVNDVSFTVPRGEALGIIGPNGSGKSTILKLLSGILRPDRGAYSVKGRLSALIEVGAGFHPDLTGRENVYLNGSILGMTRKEINAKFNQIVEFAGVEEFIDTPVKRYSSGMAVRLGFAISAFIEPDVLLVDEVLAVGDTEFRNRCANRMDKMRQNGVTMILVSHNLNEVRNLCERTVMLFKGQLLMEGPSQKVLEKYHQTMGEKIRLEQERDLAREAVSGPKPARIVELTKADLLDADGIPAETFQTGQNMTLRIHYNARKRIERPRVEVEMVWAAEDWAAAIFRSNLDNFQIPPIEGKGWIELRIGPILAEPNVYQFNIQLGDESTPAHDQLQRIRFVVAESLPIPGVFSLPHTWAAGTDESHRGTGVPPVNPTRNTGVSPVLSETQEEPDTQDAEELAAK
ncbi:MAG TPA: ABC transporter ATP-binding protein [Tepidisphaeraceae bacterium]|jgi:ABC-type polysaccharide/polyol phosphate transport system ATPase subunit|nr:ABC transporter ATP-binding protein [Tepidisphaeraceae bacterium]